MKSVRTFCFILLVLVSACSSPSKPTSATSDNSPAVQPTVSSSVTVDALIPDFNSDSNSIRATFGNGATVTDWGAYETSAGRMLSSPNGAADIDLTVSSPNSPGASPQGAHTQADVSFWVGRYFIRLSGESGQLGGCINKPQVPHLGLLIKNGPANVQLVNIHLAAWREAGRTCFAVYNSANGWCVKKCGPTRPDMERMIVDALIAAGIAAAIAALIAKLIIPIVVVALAL